MKSLMFATALATAALLSSAAVHAEGAREGKPDRPLRAEMKELREGHRAEGKEFRKGHHKEADAAREECHKKIKAAESIEDKEALIKECRGKADAMREKFREDQDKRIGERRAEMDGKFAEMKKHREEMKGRHEERRAKHEAPPAPPAE